MAPTSSSFDCTARPLVAAPPSTSAALTSAVATLAGSQCGPGRVAQPRGVAIAKKAPPAPSTKTSPAASASQPATSQTAAAADACAAKPVGAVQFHYAGAYQYVTGTGTKASLSQPQPCLATSDYHSLAELAATSVDTQQIVEVGWTVDRALNGDSLPHLFVYHWVNGQTSCYNGCGFVQYSPTRRPGMAVSVTAAVQEYAIQYYAGNWWISYQGDWVGYFPGSLWNNTFTTTGVVQWFGEVSASTSTPCTDMGNGLPAPHPSAARVDAIGYYGTTTVPALTYRPNGPYYRISANGTNAFLYGGAGAC